MYQFTTSTILNSNLDSNGVTTKFVGSATGLNVTRVGSFKKDNIVSVYKRPYQAGVKEIASITIASSTAGLVNRLVVDVRLSQQTDSEYANTYLYFKKPIVIEILSTGNTTNDATALKNQINGLKDRYGFAYITATSSGAVLTLTATNNNQRFYSITQEEEVALTLNSNSIIQPEYTVKATGAVTTAGKVGFGDDEYMIRSIMLPTYENTRYFGTNKEERPIIGGNYTQYTLRYSVTKDGNDGIVAGGTSITTHVFYVKSDLVSAFDTAISNIGLSVPSLLTYEVADDSLANEATTTSTVANAIGAVTFSRTSGTSAIINATTGVITADAAITGDTVVRATDSVGNYAEVTITVA